MIEVFFSIVVHAVSSLWRLAAAEGDKADPFCDLDRTRQSSWDQARAETYLQKFQVGRPKKVET